MKEVLSIFNQAQISNTSQLHQLKIKLANLYSPHNEEAFFKGLETALYRILHTSTKSKNSYIDQVINFLGVFCLHLTQITDKSEDDSSEHPILCKIIDYLLANLESSNNDVRLRGCQIIRKIFESLVGLDLSVNFCEKIEKEVLKRLYDPKLDVCLEAIAILSPFQDRDDPDDIIIKELQTLMAQYRVAKVRKTCLSNILISKQTINDIILRVGDVDENTRVVAVTKLAKAFGFLSISDKRKVLLQVSRDESEKMKTCVHKILIPNLFLHYKGEYLSIMKSLRLDANQEDVDVTNFLCEFVLQSLFKTTALPEMKGAIGLNDSKLIPIGELDWENCNFWRILVQYIREKEGENLGFQKELESVLPQLVDFCDYIKAFYTKISTTDSVTVFLREQFIIKQLFLIAQCFDLSETAGRNKLQILICDILQNVVLTLDTIEAIMQIIEKLYTNVEKRGQFVNELISEIVCPLNSCNNGQDIDHLKLKIKEIKNELQHIQEKQQASLAANLFSECEALENQFQEKKSEMNEVLTEMENLDEDEVLHKRSDVATIIKCLDIAIAFLLSPQITKMTPALEVLKTETICEVLKHPNETLQQKAFRAFGLLAFVDQETAKIAIHLFVLPIMSYQKGESVPNPILITCMGMTADLIRIYGTAFLAEPEQGTDLDESQREENYRAFYAGTSLSKTLKGIVNVMNDEDVDLQDHAAEAICALVLSERIRSISILSSLVLKWADPDTDSRVKRTIGLAMNHFPKMQDFLECWEVTMISVLKTLGNVPENSSLAEVDADNIAKFMISLFRMDPYAHTVESQLAFKIFAEVKAKPKEKYVPLLLKTLGIIKVAPDLVVINNLLKTCEEVKEVIRLRTSLQKLTSFKNALLKLKKSITGNELQTGSSTSSSDSESDEDVA